MQSQPGTLASKPYHALLCAPTALFVIVQCTRLETEVVALVAAEEKRAMWHQQSTGSLLPVTVLWP